MNTFKKFLRKNMKVLTALGLVITLVLSSTVAIALADSSTPAGSGTSADPYIITTASQLADIPTLGMSSYYKLGNDIDLSSYGNWTPIGSSGTPFKGVFDGNKHEITGLTIGSSASPSTIYYMGLFGYAQNATVHDVGVTGSLYENLKSSSPTVGILIGYSTNSVIYNCFTDGIVSGTYSGSYGGLAGTVALTNSSYVRNCYSAATVAGYNVFGGFIGSINGYGHIYNCFSTGSVTSNGSLKQSGAFIGILQGANSSNYVILQNCYTIGTVSSTSAVAGFIGALYNGSTIKYGYWPTDNNSTGVFSGSGTTGMTLTTMQSQTFSNTLNSNITSLSLTNAVAWKYSPTVNGGYPYLDGIGVGADTTPPTGTFSISPSDSTPGPVTITLTATDDMSGVSSITLPDGSTVTTATATYQVSANGDYSFTVKDNAGNLATLTETVSNISATSTTPNLSVAATYALSSDSTSATVMADVTDDSGMTISAMAYASGTQTVGYFASAGTAITPSASSGSGVIGIGTFSVSSNGDYTVYVKDSSGNEAVQTVTVSGIGSDSSSSSSDPGSNSSDPGSSSSDPSSSSSDPSSSSSDPSSSSSDPGSSSSSSSSSSESTSQTDTVGVSGTISASGISVTHPTTINYTIDANGNFVSPDFPITNNSAGPVKVTVESLKSVAGGSLQFTDVDPLSENWSNLDLADSLKYIALGIGADTSTAWTSGESTGTFWSVNTTPLAIGDIASAGNASLKLTAYNGKVFDKSYTAEHSLVLEFNLD